MTDTIITNEEKLKAIGGGGDDWIHIAAEKTGLAVKTLYNARSARVSPRTQRIIDTHYSAVSSVAPVEPTTRPEAVARDWAIGRHITASEDPSIWGECVVSHLSDPAFSAHVLIRRGARDKEPVSKKDVEMRLSSICGTAQRLGDLIEKAQELGYLHLTRLERWHSLLPHQRRRMENRIATAEGELTDDEIARMGMDDLLSVVRTMNERELVTAELVADRLEAEADSEASRLNGYGMDEIIMKDSYRAGRRKERSEWMRRIIADARATREPAPGLNHVRDYVERAATKA